MANFNTLINYLSDGAYGKVVTQALNDNVNRAQDVLTQMVNDISNDEVTIQSKKTLALINNQLCMIDVRDVVSAIVNDIDDPVINAVNATGETISVNAEEAINCLADSISAMQILQESILSTTSEMVKDGVGQANDFITRINIRYNQIEDSMKGLVYNTRMIVGSSAPVRSKIYTLFNYFGLGSNSLGEVTSADLSQTTGISVWTACGVAANYVGQTILTCFEAIKLGIVTGITRLANLIDGEAIVKGANSFLGTLLTYKDAFDESDKYQNVGFSNYYVAEKFNVSNPSVLAILREDMYLVLPLGVGDLYLWKSNGHFYAKVYIYPIRYDLASSAIDGPMSLETLCGGIDLGNSTSVDTIQLVMSGIVRNIDTYIPSDSEMAKAVYWGYRAAVLMLASYLVVGRDGVNADVVTADDILHAYYIILGTTTFVHNEFKDGGNIDNRDLAEALINSTNGAIHEWTGSTAATVSGYVLSIISPIAHAGDSAYNGLIPPYYFTTDVPVGKYTVRSDQAFVDGLAHLGLSLIVVTAAIGTLVLARAISVQAFKLDAQSQARAWSLAEKNSLTTAEAAVLRRQYKKASILASISSKILGFIPKTLTAIVTGISSVANTATGFVKNLVNGVKQDTNTNIPLNLQQAVSSINSNVDTKTQDVTRLITGE